MSTAAWHAFVLAFGLILPLGPQNLFLFSQGATQPRLLRAWPAVATAAACDSLLIAAAVFGVSLAALSHPLLAAALYAAGVVFLIVMGYSQWRSRPAPADPQAAVPALPGRKQAAYAASVSLLNPHALLDTAGVIGTGSLAYDGADKTIFALVSIAVSWIWFAALAAAGRLIGRMKGSVRIMAALGRLSALTLWAMAAVMAAGLLSRLGL
ncbi:LysE family transporter [Paenibacillus albicereus]|uniref:LysE family transporter n=1 Tax=Paenibacillus albicereus TaxID=2726185 RepID=A0A6H2GXA5_9BACL|nr:LysE family transporter [Paenibacillus albicereus]QJC51989.1 LysE family transporter [Paenibacillus albicereus]